MEHHKVPRGLFDSRRAGLEKLAALFPAAVKDGQLDLAALREELGRPEEAAAEKYELTWAGKQSVKRAAQSDVAGRTLNYIPEDSKHADTTENLYIEGDNLEVLKLLRQNYYGAVRLAYIDPPYNTDGDFIYRDSFVMDAAASDEAEGNMSDGARLVANQYSSNRYHANWLNMMYPRLRVARDLLAEDGLILINIDEHEVTNLQAICAEIFYEANDLGTIVWDKRNPKGDARGISCQHEYILCYAKNKEAFLERCAMRRPKKNAELMLKKAAQLFKKVEGSYTLDAANQAFVDWLARQKDMSGGERAYQRIDRDGALYQAVSMAWPNNKQAPEEYFIPLIHPVTSKPCPVPEKGWRNPPETMRELLEKDLIVFGADETTQPRRKYLLRENMEENIPSLLYYGGSDADMLSKLGIPFDTPKVVSLVMEHIRSFTEDGDIILDFFSGSSTTAHATMQLNADTGGRRTFIMVQVREDLDQNYRDAPRDEKTVIQKSIDFLDSIHRPHYITEIGKERIRRAGERVRAEVEAANAQRKPGEAPRPVPDIGFRVFRTADTNIRWTHAALRDEAGEYDPAALADKQSLDFMLGTKDVDVVYEILLRQRDVPLSAKVERLDIGRRTYRFAGACVVCLDEAVSPDLVEALAAIVPAPVKYVFRDSAFDDDISFKDETIRRLDAYIARKSGARKKAYTVEFI